jgi:hypothetical protein
MGDPWAVLGVEAGVGFEEARRAYLVRLQLLHPDHHQGAGAAVLAEAERATRELTEAWEAVQARVGDPVGPGAGTEGPPAGADGRRPPEGAGACLRWAVDRLIAAASSEGRPLKAAEVDLLLRPLADAPTGRKFQRWLIGRRATLAIAVDADGVDAWAAAVRTLSDGGPAAVLTLLFAR